MSDEDSMNREETTGDLLRARDLDRQQRAREQRELRIDKREMDKAGMQHKGQLNHITINGPHTAELVNGALSINIDLSGAGTAGGAGTGGAIEVVVTGNLNGAPSTGTALFTVPPS